MIDNLTETLVNKTIDGRFNTLSNIPKTGTYTGDGSTSLAITGLGFKPKVLVILLGVADGVAGSVFITTDTLVLTDAQGLAHSFTSGTLLDNRILSLNADGFTVSDDSADAHPNATSATYHYIAFA